MCKFYVQLFCYLGYFLYLCGEFMETERKINTHALVRRIIYMVIAIAASALLFTRPVFRFQDDKGIIYVRSFAMDEKTFVVTQTELSTGIQQEVATVSVKGLYYCNKVMLWGCILCFLCFFSRNWRMRIAVATAVVAGVYYALMAHYAITISDTQYATLYPTLMAVLPAIVLQMMIMTRHNILSCIAEEDELPD